MAQMVGSFPPEVEKVVTIFRDAASARQRRVQELIDAGSFESVAARQAANLIALTDNGVQDLIVGIARYLKQDHPDIRVGVTKPTGNPDDLMAVVVDRDHRRTRKGLTFKRIAVVAQQGSNSGEDDARFHRFSLIEGDTFGDLMANLRLQFQIQEGQEDRKTPLTLLSADIAELFENTGQSQIVIPGDSTNVSRIGRAIIDIPLGSPAPAPAAS